MGYQDNFPKVSVSMMDEFGESIIYTPAGGGDPSPISGIPDFGEDLDDAQWRAALQASAEIQILESDVADPQPNDTITIDEVDWTVVRKVSRSGGMWRLALRRDLRPTFRK